MSFFFSGSIKVKEMAAAFQISEDFWTKLMQLRNNLIAIDESNRIIGTKEKGANIFQTNKSISKFVN